ncbi:MAG: hypothetical protein LBU48_04365 [Coriobacteriales bacterium]|jgi:hypothetical protein|nr:hypothetical protein [Coriobacteriales bacterium]
MSEQRQKKGIGFWARTPAATEPLPQSTQTRISRIPYSDCYPSTYGQLEGLNTFERELDQRLEGLLRGAVDCGNGSVFDAQIDSATQAAHFELEIEHTLRISMAQLIVMRNQGDAAKVDEQLQDVRSRLAAANRELMQAREQLAQVEDSGFLRLRKTQKAQQAEQARRAKDAEKAQSSAKPPPSKRARKTEKAPRIGKLVKDHGID